MGTVHTKTAGWMWAAGLSLVAGSADAAEPHAMRSPLEPHLPLSRPVKLHVDLTFGPVFPTGDIVPLVYAGPHYKLGMGARYALLEGLSLGASLGYIKHDGLAVGAASGTVSEEVTTLKLYPMGLGLTYRLTQLDLGTVVPYAGAGVDLTAYSELVGTTTYTGGKWGLHAHAGVEVVLEPPAPSWTSDAREGLQSTALLIELGYRTGNNFGASKLDFSGLGLNIGFALGF
ncbi:MAG: hypothetical protein ACKO6N_09835 [Myxococcota bacterium]